MRSRNSLILGAALLSGGCSGAWWHDSPAAGTLPPSGANDPARLAYPDQRRPATGYPAPLPADAQPPADPQSQYDQPPAYGTPPPADTAPMPRSYPPRSPDPTPSYPDPASQRTPAYDNVGYAVWSANPGTVAGAHPSLPPGSFVEVTALDSGKTILVPITAGSRPGREIELSGAAAQELGLPPGGGSAAVRVRSTNASGADILALRAGRPAPARPDTPPVLLNALRHKLNGTLGQVTPDFGAAPNAGPPPADQPIPHAAPVTRPAAPVRQPTAPPAATTARSGPGYYVQIAALSDAARAQSIARSVGGRVSSAGGLHRVRFGPFDDLRTAQAARDDVAARGYGDARIIRE